MSKYHLKYGGEKINELLDKAGSALQEHQDISHLVEDKTFQDAIAAKVDKAEGKGLSSEDFTADEKSKLATLENYDDTGIKTSVSKVEKNLQRVENTVTTKVDKVSGKQLSSEDFTKALKAKLNSLENYDDTAVNAAIASLSKRLDTLIGGNSSAAIDSFNEIIAFLDGVSDSQGLDNIIAAIEQQIATKQDKLINGVNIKTVNGKSILGEGNIEIEGVAGDVDTTTCIKYVAQELTDEQKAQARENIGALEQESLASVATSGSYNDLEDKPNIPTESTVSGWGFTKNAGTYTKPSGGIPKTDLESAVQTSLNKADTALQSVPSEYVTDDDLMWVKAEGEAGVRLKGTNGTATGKLAISAGDDKTASDGTQFTSAASGDHAVAFGYGNTCAGRSTLAQGLYNIVNGKDSVAFGQQNTVNGDQAFAVGQQNEVTARLGTAIGYQNKATNTNSIAIGYKNTSGGSGSVALGDTCESNGTSSTAMGYKTKATGTYASTFGENTQATNNGEVAMGSYNKSTTSTDASEQTSFSFGIGTSDTNRLNAFEIKKNGDVYIGGKLFGDYALKTDVAAAIAEAITKTLNTAV